MNDVELSGHLVCRSAEESDLVLQHLPEHLALTRAEPGCVSFEVTPTENPLIWKVEERFSDSESFRAHQARAAASEWGRATVAIERDYTITGLTDRPLTGKP